jgi:serine/threonine protein kinase
MLGDFRIVRKLGEGGMGVVYEAEQQHPKRPVALKVIRGGAFVDDNQIKMFQREAQTLARLKHPAIAAIYEMGRTEQGQHFFAMELVRGETLGAWLGHGSPDLRLRLALFRKICDAVAYAHQRGVIHRDIKPSNILVLKESSSASTASSVGIPDVKVLDFGLARITDTDVAASSFVTDMGTVRGTLPYMSPEQIRGNPDEIDLRTDVYSLGVLLYEMLTGRLPHDLKNAAIAEAARIICAEPPAPLTKTWGGTKRLDADVVTSVTQA